MSEIKAADVLRKRFQRWRRPVLVAVPIVIILVVLLVLQPWSASPVDLIAGAYAATTELQSYRVFSFTTYTYESKTVDITWEIEFAAPDRYHAKVTVDDDVNEVIIIGDKQYAREPRGGKVVATVIERSFPPLPCAIKKSECMSLGSPHSTADCQVYQQSVPDYTALVRPLVLKGTVHLVHVAVLGVGW